MTQTNAAFPHTLTSDSLTFFVAGRPTQVLKSHPKFNEVLQAALNGDESAVDLAKPVVKVAETLKSVTSGEGDDEAARWFRRNPVDVQVTDWGVTVDGKGIHGAVVDRLMAVAAAGADVTAWVRFVEKLYQNPSSTSRDELYLWLEKSNLPITADGDFLAYKIVRPDYKDIHSGTFDNSVGKVVSMNRNDVDDDRNRTCSAGLHFCSEGYLPSFGSSGTGSRVILLKINPADVVSIPSDYDNAKGRTWRYEVVEDLGYKHDVIGRQWDAVSDYGSDAVSDYDDEEDYGDEPEEDDWETAPTSLIGAVFGAYANTFGKGSTKDGTERDVRLLRANAILAKSDYDDEIYSFGDLTNGAAKALIAAWG